MAQYPQLRALLCLVDDHSPVVFNAVHQKLREYGESFWKDFRENLLPVSPTPEETMALNYHRLLFGERQLASEWLGWKSIPMGDHNQLEFALSLLSRFFHQDEAWFRPLSELLDDLAEGYIECLDGLDADEISLAEYLFDREAGKLNTDRISRANWHHCEPAWVIKHRTGTPLALTLVYLMVGARFGLDLELSVFPGYCYARFQTKGIDDDPIYVDAFNFGRIMRQKEILEQVSGPDWCILSQMLNAKYCVKSILARTLRQLAEARAHDCAEEDQNFLVELMEQLLEVK